MKNLYLIGGTMGIGKTAVCQHLKKKLDCAVFLDGDWCWDSDPFVVNDETKKMVMDHICFLLNSFLSCSVYENVIFCWVMHEQSIIDTIVSRLDLTDISLHDNEKPFLMAVEDVFTITGRGTVATGRVERGMLKLNDDVEIVGIRPTSKTVVTGIEMFRKTLDFAQAGDNIGALLRGVNREQIERGQVLAKPGSVTPHTKFKAQVYVLTKEEGGRHTPFVSNYRPQFYFRTTDVTGVITLPEGTELCMPGDNVVMTVELLAPIAIENGTKFSIREGGRTVGSGSITEIEA